MVLGQSSRWVRQQSQTVWRYKWSNKEIDPTYALSEVSVINARQFNQAATARTRKCYKVAHDELIGTSIRMVIILHANNRISVAICVRVQSERIQVDKSIRKK